LVQELPKRALSPMDEIASQVKAGVKLRKSVVEPKEKKANGNGLFSTALSQLSAALNGSHTHHTRSSSSYASHKNPLMRITQTPLMRITQTPLIRITLLSCRSARPDHRR
jgi:hypothetical protein